MSRRMFLRGKCCGKAVAGKVCKSEHGAKIHQAKDPYCGQAGHKITNERTERCGKCSAYFKKIGMKIHERTCDSVEVMRRKTNAIRQVETPTVDPTPSVLAIPPMSSNQPTTESDDRSDEREVDSEAPEIW
ncbi:hypothetical protein RvY_10327 [Ramazzottius varieornatus]|uniref:Uncharacterized protein n=1 Tax=Ramazzottius varieornatus TaxID=947166 RepID=A0A1D1VGW7_RAMVA|nr:hypothetical protein RvY_10327 [Ramazzottius varieornatus]